MRNVIKQCEQTDVQYSSSRANDNQNPDIERKTQEPQRFMTYCTVHVCMSSMTAEKGMLHSDGHDTQNPIPILSISVFRPIPILGDTLKSDTVRY